jgi:hypothetical protein
VLCAICAVFLPCSAQADGSKIKSLSPSGNTASINASAFGTSARGSIQVNQTAGNGNLQANVNVIGATPSTVVLKQSPVVTAAEAGNAIFAGRAFANAFGTIQVNQSAGAGNAQGNVINVQSGSATIQLTDSAMAATTSSPRHADSDLPNTGSTVSASQGSFAGTGGIVQVNQTAGTANHTVNSFQLQLPHGPTL